MMEFWFGILAVWFGLNTLKPLLPFELSARLVMPVAGLMSWGYLCLPPHVQLGLAIAGVVLLLYQVVYGLLEFELPQGWDWRQYVHLPVIRRPRKREMGFAPSPSRKIGHRIPPL